jgi:hypothetical protein
LGVSFALDDFWIRSHCIMLLQRHHVWRS